MQLINYDPEVYDILLMAYPLIDFISHDTNNDDFSTPLHLAKTVDVVEALLEMGVNPDIKDCHGLTPLYNNENLEIVQLLLQYGADANIECGKYGDRPLFFAMSPAITQLLINYGADPNAPNYCDETPLHLTKNAEIAQVLIDNGADPNAKECNGDTPLEGAYTSDEVKELLKKYSTK